MKWCPCCRSEHDEDMKHCPECGEKLEDEMPDEKDELLTDVKWVTVAEKMGPVMGRLIKQRLESIGIPAILKGGGIDTVQVYAGYDTILRVPQRCLTEAKELVEDMLNAGEEGMVCSNCGTSVTEEDLTCPNCGENFVEEEGQEE